jgi:hypothetical protein
MKATFPSVDTAFLFYYIHVLDVKKYEVILAVIIY